MIKAEELMIGNWVYNIEASQNQQVSQIQCDSVILDESYTYYYNEIEPIHITGEILEKNGFKKEDDDCYLWNGNRERIIWFDDCYTVITSVMCDRMYEGHCYDIHKLQQLLKLCGINKEIIA